MGQRIDMTGQVIGRVTVLSFAGMAKNGGALWNCLCACGNNLTVAGENIRRWEKVDRIGFSSCECYKNTIGRKRCLKCGEEKPIESFVKDPRTKGGYSGVCDDCERKRRVSIYSANKEHIHKRKSSHRKKHQEKVKAADLAYRIAHREELRRNSKKWRAAHPERRKEHANNWCHRHPQKAADCRRRSMARRSGAHIEKFEAWEIFERDRWICQLCKKKVNKRLKYPHPLSPSLDHIIPLAKGGRHERKNAHLAHLVCNMSAGTKGVKQLRLIE